MYSIDYQGFRIRKTSTYDDRKYKYRFSRKFFKPNPALGS